MKILIEACNSFNKKSENIDSQSDSFNKKSENIYLNSDSYNKKMMICQTLASNQKSLKKL